VRIFVAAYLVSKYLTDFNGANKAECYKILLFSLSPSPFENGREAATRDTMDLIGGTIGVPVANTDSIRGHECMVMQKCNSIITLVLYIEKFAVGTSFTDTCATRGVQL
jgi:hypothetical protein